MDIRLVRRPHPSPMVRASELEPLDPYLEWCWGPVVGPSTVALVRRIAVLTEDHGEPRVALDDLGQLIGLGKVDIPRPNNRVVRTLRRAEQFGLAFTQLEHLGDELTFGINAQVALVPRRLLPRLPEVSRERHRATIEQLNRTLADAGLPALVRDVATQEAPTWAHGALGTRPDRVEPIRTPRDATPHQAIPPIARLTDGRASAEHPGLSL